MWLIALIVTFFIGAAGAAAAGFDVSAGFVAAAAAAGALVAAAGAAAAVVGAAAAGAVVGAAAAGFGASVGFGTAVGGVFGPQAARRMAAAELAPRARNE